MSSKSQTTKKINYKDRLEFAVRVMIVCPINTYTIIILQFISFKFGVSFSHRFLSLSYGRRYTLEREHFINRIGYSKAKKKKLSPEQNKKGTR